MLHQGEKTHITIRIEQRQALRQLARQEGQSIDELIAQILQEGIDKRQYGRCPMTKTERLQALERIEEHRRAFLARRHNQPLTIDPVALLDQIREEHDQHLLSLYQPISTDRD